MQPEIAEQLVEKTRLLKWLLTRIRPREFDGNKQEASELLAILAQVWKEVRSLIYWSLKRG